MASCFDHIGQKVDQKGKQEEVGQAVVQNYHYRQGLACNENSMFVLRAGKVFRVVAIKQTGTEIRSFAAPRLIITDFSKQPRPKRNALWERRISSSFLPGLPIDEFRVISAGTSSTGPEAHSRPGAGKTCLVLSAYHATVAMRVVSKDPTIVIPCYPPRFMRTLSPPAARFTTDADVVRATGIAVRIVWPYYRSIARNPAAEATGRYVVEGKD